MTSVRCKWQLIAFDCDGVIVDSFKLVDTILGELCDGDPNRSHYKPGESLREMFVGDPWANLRASFNILPDELNDPLEKRYGETGIFHGVAATIRLLGGLETPPKIAVITSNRNSTVFRRLQNAGLSEHIDPALIWGKDTSFKGLSKDEEKSRKAVLIEKFVRMNNCKKKHCCFIGDTQSDVKAAAQAGVTSIGAAWGYHPKSLLTDVKAVHTVEFEGELADILLS